MDSMIQAVQGTDESDNAAARIVVIGAPRSGTTVIKRYLASNHGCKNTPYPQDLGQVLAHKEGDYLPVWKRTRWTDPERIEEVVSLLKDDTFFVLIVRYPTCCYDSTVELDLFRGRTSHKWLPHGSKAEYLAWWERAHRLALSVLSKVSHVVVPYEDFCVRPQHWRSLILGTMGLKGEEGQRYNNRGFYIEDEKCVAHSEIHRKSVFRTPEDSGISTLYQSVVGFPCPGRLAAPQTVDNGSAFDSELVIARPWDEVQDVEGWLR